MTEIPLQAPDLAHLLPAIDRKLMELLASLTEAEWQAPTIAKKWLVKDVAAHLLDGNIRSLSMLRDGYFGEKSPDSSYTALTDFLNELNAGWVNAMKRVSPSMLITLLALTGPMYCNYYSSLNPDETAGFAVNWAGESKSTNRFHIAREYTEKWLHQQQIRDAVHKPGLLNKEFFHPFIHTFIMALPYTYRQVPAKENTVLQITVTGEGGGSWWLVKYSDKWILTGKTDKPVAAVVTIEDDLAWRLFSKSISPKEARNSINIEGDMTLGETVLNMVSVMA